MPPPSPSPPTGDPPPEDLPTVQLSRRDTGGSAASSGSSSSDSTSSSSSSSSSLGSEHAGGEQKFRRVDSDDDVEVTRRRRSTTASAAAGGGGDGDRRTSVTGWWRRTSVTSDGGRRESIGRAVGGGGAHSRREARALAASRGRLRAALLARDPGGYKRALAEKHDLEALFTGLAKLGDAVTAARARGLTDLSRMLDDERAGVRQALDAALSEADEDAALAGLAAAGAKMEGALAMWAASAEEAAAEAAAAHAALPWYARWADVDGDGVVSYREKRLWVTLGLLFLTTATCIVLVALLVRDFVTDLKNPITHARFEDVESLPVPRLSFCVEGPAFSTRLRGSRSYAGPSLFEITYVRMPPGANTTTPGVIVEDPIGAGLIQELPKGPENCSDSTGILSTHHQGVTGIDCVYCYEKKVDDRLVLHRGETAEENKLHNVELHFESYAPFTDCMVAPKDINESLTVLQALISSDTHLPELKRKGILTVTSGVDNGTTIDAAAVLSMTSVQLCNTAFFSGHFYPTPDGEGTPRYLWNGAAWTVVNAADEFSAALVDYDPGVDVHVLDLLSDADNRNAHDHESIAGVPLGRVASNSLTQLFLSKRTLEHRARKGAERIRTSEEQYVAKADVYPRLQKREEGKNFFHVSIAFFSFTVEHYSTRSTYTVPMFLEQVIGYGGNFLGLSVFTFVVAPLLFMLGRQDASRASAAAAKDAEALLEEGGGGGGGGGGRVSIGGGGGGGGDSDVESGGGGGGAAAGAAGRPSTSSALDMLGRVSPRTSAFGVLSRERVARRAEPSAGVGGAGGVLRSREISSWSMPAFLRGGGGGDGGGGGAAGGSGGAANGAGWAAAADQSGGSGV